MNSDILPSPFDLRTLRRPVRRSGCLLAAFAAVLAFNSAEAKIQLGAADTVVAARVCALIGVQVKSTATAWAGFDTRGDTDEPYRVGEVFYVTAEIGNPAFGSCSSGQDVLPSFFLPKGMEFAIAPERPALWGYSSEGSPEITLEAAATVPSVLPAGGITVVPPASVTDGSTWPVADRILVIRVPVVAKRRMAGIGGGALTCAQREAQSVCPPELAGDFLQLYVATRESPARPVQGIFVADADPKGPPPNPTPLPTPVRSDSSATFQDGRLQLQTGYAAKTRLIVQVGINGKKKLRTLRLKLKDGTGALKIRLTQKERIAAQQGLLLLKVRPKGEAIAEDVSVQ